MLRARQSSAGMLSPAQIITNTDTTTRHHAKNERLWKTESQIGCFDQSSPFSTPEALGKGNRKNVRVKGD